jgi:TonB family protein
MKRAPRLLLLAFALSLLIHLIVAVVLRPPAPTTTNQAEVVSIEHRPASIAVRRLETPPPPQRTPSPKVVSSAPPRALKGAAAPAGAGPVRAAPKPAATPLPSPAARASAACTQPNADPALAVEPSPPDIAPEARTSGTSGTTLVRVLIDATGQVTNAGVTQSSGNSSLDLVAVTMARGARYTPALHDCKPIAGAYTFSVKFAAW